MKAIERPPADLSEMLALVATRRILVVSPTIHYRLEPGDRALVEVGDDVTVGAPIAERTPDAESIDVGRLENGTEPIKGRRIGGGGKSESAVDMWPPVWPEPDASGPRVEGRDQMAVKVRTGPAVISQRERRRPPEPGKWWIGGG